MVATRDHTRPAGKRTGVLNARGLRQMRMLALASGSGSADARRTQCLENYVDASLVGAVLNVGVLTMIPDPAGVASANRLQSAPLDRGCRCHDQREQHGQHQSRDRQVGRQEVQATIVAEEVLGPAALPAVVRQPPYGCQ